MVAIRKIMNVVELFSEFFNPPTMFVLSHNEPGTMITNTEVPLLFQLDRENKMEKCSELREQSGGGLDQKY